MCTPRKVMTKPRPGRSIFLLVLLFFILLAGLPGPPCLQSQEAGIKGEKPEEGRKESRTFTFSGDSTSISFAENRQYTVLRGNALITSGDLKITARRIELYGEDFRYARCSGSVKVDDSGQRISLTAESLYYDREREFLRIRDYTEMVDLRNELVIKCGYLEHYNKEDYSVFQIGVRILKATEGGSMVCRSDFARYDRGKDLLELSGSPVVYWKGDRYSAVRITVNLETEEITLEGEVEGEFTSEDE